MISVNEIRAELVKLGCDPEKIKSMGKKDCRELLQTMKASSEALEQSIPDPSNVNNKMDALNENIAALPETSTKIDKKAPARDDPEWTEYVIGLLTDKEKIQNYPKADGLRRIANKVFGAINIQTNVLQYPNKDDNRATVVCRISTPNGIITEGAADCHRGNTPYEFLNHAISTAETRAEGKALKKLLCLSGVYTIEEMSNADVIPEEDDSQIAIQSPMLNGILAKCNLMKIDLNKLIAYCEIDVVSPKDMTKKDGKVIIQKLTEFQNSDIPANIIKETK